MYQIKYILVNETVHQNTVCDARHRFIPHIGHCVEVCCEEHSKLLSQLCELRRHWPDAKILGVSELDVSASHAPVRGNPWMNALRRALSDLP